MSSTVSTKQGRQLIPSDVARLTAQAQEFIRGCHRWSHTVGEENHIRSVTLYPPSQSRNGMWMVIGKAWSGGYKLVAFHRASDPLTALAGFFVRATQGKLEWKEDSFAER